MKLKEETITETLYGTGYLTNNANGFQPLSLTREQRPKYKTKEAALKGMKKDYESIIKYYKESAREAAAMEAINRLPPIEDIKVYKVTTTTTTTVEVI